MGRLTSLLFLVGLGASAGLLPQKLQSLMPKLPLPVPAAVPSSAQLGGELPQNLTEVAELSSAINRAVQTEAGSLEGLSAEERDLHESASHEVKVMANPLLAKMLELSSPNARAAGGAQPSMLGGLPDPARLAELIEEWKPRVQAGIWGFCLGMVALSALLLVLGQKGLSRLLCGLVHSLSGWWLWGISLSAAAAFVFAQLNLWDGLPSELWAAPSAGLLASAGLLRTLDMNAPVWNGTLLSLLAPLGSCAFIAGAAALRGLA